MPKQITTIQKCAWGFAALFLGVYLLDYVPGIMDAKDRKSTRLNSSHGYISYAVFCLKKKNKAAGIGRTCGWCRSTSTSDRRAIRAPTGPASSSLPFTPRSQLLSAAAVTSTVGKAGIS